MAIVLFLEERKLPKGIKTIFNQALVNDIQIGFSAVSLKEIGYLSERSRIDLTITDVVSFVNIK